MTLQQGIEIVKLAKSAGYGVQVSKGRVRFVTWIEHPDGVSDIIPHTDWLDYDEAIEILEG